ncbi:MAG: purine-nucleoside phosphorylase, partial [Elusimicrobiota bacterium]
MKYEEKVKKAAEKIKSKLKTRPSAGLIMGSGMGYIADEIKKPQIINFADIPFFPRASVKGHRGRIVAGKLHGKNIMLFDGRIHFYQDCGMDEVVFPVYIMAYLGIDKLILSNAAGALNKNFKPGDIVLIKDHINLMGSNPLKGRAGFVDMTEAYDLGLRKCALKAAADTGLKIYEGVYAAMPGPSYETPAEIKMLKTIGADMVGMSTVPEVIAANKLSLKTLGISIITN